MNNDRSRAREKEARTFLYIIVVTQFSSTGRDYVIRNLLLLYYYYYEYNCKILYTGKEEDDNCYCILCKL